MYDKIFEKESELIDEYEEAKESGNKQKMLEIAEELKEIETLLNTEFF